MWVRYSNNIIAFYTAGFKNKFSNNVYNKFSCTGRPCSRPVGCGLAQLDLTIGGVKPTSEGHSFISLCRGPIQIFVWRGPIQTAGKLPKIAENRATYGGSGSPAARAADTYHQNR
jgi:hypothetical protein